MKSAFAAARIVLIAWAVVDPAAAQQPPAGAPRPPAQAPNPVMEAAQAAFDALPEAARRQLQDDLIWGSNFTATTSAQFGARTLAAIVNFQRLIRAPQNGVLDPAQRKALADAASRTRASMRLAVQADPRSGASLPIAQALFTKRETLPTGTRWESSDGQVVLETGVGQGGAAQLPAAFERFVSLPTPNRKVTYKLLRPDFFVVSGEIGPRSFYVRYAVGPNNLRGYALSYPTARSADMERHVIAIANGFQAVPGQAPAADVAAGPGPQGQGTSVAPPAANPNTIPAGHFLTGVAVAANRIATAPLAAACADLRVNGRPARVVSPGGETEAATIETDAGGLKALAAAPATAAAQDVVVVGFSPGARPTLSVAGGVVFVAAAGMRLSAPLHREGGGSAIFDRQGRLVGIVDAPHQAPRLVAGLMPSVSHAALKLSLPARPAAVDQGRAKSAGAIAAEAAASLIPIACGQPVTLRK